MTIRSKNTACGVFVWLVLPAAHIVSQKNLACGSFFMKNRRLNHSRMLFGNAFFVFRNFSYTFFVFRNLCILFAPCSGLVLKLRRKKERKCSSFSFHIAFLSWRKVKQSCRLCLPTSGSTTIRRWATVWDSLVGPSWLVRDFNFPQRKKERKVEDMYPVASVCTRPSGAPPYPSCLAPCATSFAGCCK